MKIGKIVFILMLTSSLMVSNAMAASEEDTVLETVVVSGSGVKSKLLDTNAAIHVITAKDIKTSGQTSTADLISSIPEVVNQKSGSKTYFSVRGTRTSMSGGPKIYLDGRPLNVGVYDYSKIDTIPLDSIEKIEVVKSPSTAKYGASAGRGVILITTKKGDSAAKKVSGTISGEVGSWSTYKVNAGINGSTDKIDYSVLASKYQSDGYRDDDRDVKSIDTQLGWKFDGARIDWILGYNEASNLYPVGLPEWQLDRDPTVAAVNSKEDGSGYLILPNETDEQLFNTLLRLDYDKKDWLGNASVGFSRDQQDFSYQKYINHPTRQYYTYEDDRTENIYDIAASVGRKFSGKEVFDTLTFGVDYRYSDFEQDRSYPYDTGGLRAKTEAKADIDATKKLLGINLNNDLSWNIFRLETGLRYNRVSYELSNAQSDSVDADFNNDIDWSISPSLSIWDNTNLFVSWNYSHFYLPLGFYKSNMEKDFDEELDPEIYNTVELGWKHQVNKGFNYSIILYWTRVEDKVASYYQGTTLQGRRNAGTSIHKGIELEVDGRPLPLVGYRISFSTIDAEWEDGEYVGYANTGDASKSLLDLSGKKVNYVPEYEYIAGLDLYPVRDSSWGSVTVSLDLRGYGEQYEDFNNNEKMPSAHFVDAKVSWVYKGVTSYLTCTNLFDKEWTRVVNASGASHDSLSGFYPQDGRYVGVGASFNF